MFDDLWAHVRPTTSLHAVLQGIEDVSATIGRAFDRARPCVRCYCICTGNLPMLQEIRDFRERRQPWVNWGCKSYLPCVLSWKFGVNMPSFYLTDRGHYAASIAFSMALRHHSVDRARLPNAARILCTVAESSGGARSICTLAHPVVLRRLLKDTDRYGEDVNAVLCASFRMAERMMPRSMRAAYLSTHDRLMCLPGGPRPNAIVAERYRKAVAWLDALYGTYDRLPPEMMIPIFNVATGMRERDWIAWRRTHPLKRARPK